MGEVIKLPERYRGNGALEVMRKYFRPIGPSASSLVLLPERGYLPRADHFLCWLWAEGFKVVPIEEPPSEKPT